jgi:hypothetical protein
VFQFSMDLTAWRINRDYRVSLELDCVREEDAITGHSAEHCR